MEMIRVVWGTGSANTKMASYDAALADAGIENYNLITVSSVIPDGARVESVDVAPDLGPIGNSLTVVEAKATCAGPGRVSAGIGWSQAKENGPGLFYEESGEVDSETIQTRINEGLSIGEQLRDWEFTTRDVRVETAIANSGEYTTTVVLAVYGRSDPIL